MTTKPAEGELLAAAASPITEYKQTEAGLAELREQYKTVPDVQTKDGMELAREARRNCVALRSTIEERRRELKAPVLDRGRLIDAEAKRITDEISKVETPFDLAIKAEEGRIEAAREAKRKAAAERRAKIDAQLAAIRDFPLQHLSSSAEALALAIAEVPDPEQFALDEDYQAEAKRLYDTTIERLQMMREARLESDRVRAEQEAEAARLAAERAAHDAEIAAQRQRDERDAARRKQLDAMIAGIRDFGLGLREPAEITEAMATLAGMPTDEATYHSRAAEAVEAQAQAKHRLQLQLDEALTHKAEQERMAAEQKRLDEQAAEQSRREAEAEAARLAQEQAAAEALAKREAELLAEQLDKVTLVEAAVEARDLIASEHGPEHATVRKLDAAIARAVNPPKAANERPVRSRPKTA